MYSGRKKELLALCEKKNPRLVYELNANEGGDLSFGFWKWDLRGVNVPVRVQVAKGTEFTEAVRLLEKLLASFRESGFCPDDSYVPGIFECVPGMNPEAHDAAAVQGEMAAEGIERLIAEYADLRVHEIAPA